MENWSLNQANHYYRLIYDELDFTLEDFESGKDIGKVKLGYRQTKIKSHLIIYKMADDSVIEIVSVLHERMDIPD